MTGVFPSSEHFDLLKEIGDAGRNGRPDYRRDWAVYDYAWRRVMLRNATDSSPFDSEQKFYIPKLIDWAEDYWREKFDRRPKSLPEDPTDKYRSPWFQGLKPEEQDRIHNQDFALEAGRRAIKDEDLADPRSPEKVAFVELCVRQSNENIECLSARMRLYRAVGDRVAPPDDEVRRLRRLREDLGVSAREAGEATEEGENGDAV